jgi:hypothetical protein
MTLDKKVEEEIINEIQNGYAKLTIDESEELSNIEKEHDFEYDQQNFSLKKGISYKHLKLVVAYVEVFLKYYKYDFLIEEDYKKRIKELFSFGLTNEIILYYKNGIGIKFEKNSWIELEEDTDILVISNKGFIFPIYRLPELLNYKKLYPRLARDEDEFQIELNKNNNESIILWKDITGDIREHQENITTIITLIVKLNEYLFNNKKQNFSFLCSKQNILERFFLVYGYNEDIQIIEKIFFDREEDKHIYIDDLIYYKGVSKLASLEEEPIYDGVFKIHDNTFSIIYNKLEGQVFHVPTENIYLKKLHLVLGNLKKEDRLSKEEKKKLSCYIIEFFDIFILDIKNIESLSKYGCKDQSTE